MICEKSIISEEAFAATWKRVAVQSERQLGAFTFLYLLENGKPPRALPNTMMTFRNDVIHRGKLPKKQEAVKYGQEILDLIAPVLEELKAHREEISKVIGRHVSKTRKQISGAPDTSFLSISTTISIARTRGLPQPTLKILCGNLNRNGDGQNGKELTAGMEVPLGDFNIGLSSSPRSARVPDGADPGEAPDEIPIILKQSAASIRHCSRLVIESRRATWRSAIAVDDLWVLRCRPVCLSPFGFRETPTYGFAGDWCTGASIFALHVVSHHRCSRRTR